MRSRRPLSTAPTIVESGEKWIASSARECMTTSVAPPPARWSMSWSSPSALPIQAIQLPSGETAGARPMPTRRRLEPSSAAT